MMRINVRPGERIQIGDDIIIVIEEKSGQCARIGIDAPRNMEIKRVWSAANDNAYGVSPTKFELQANQNIDAAK